jgi:citrate lyase subunit beta/citryl-CoA lyase
MRSMLFVPGDRPERFAKAMASLADAVIFDLEDAVMPAKREDARREIAAFLASASRSCGLWVRINSLDSHAAQDDLRAVLPARPDGIVLPKTSGAEDAWELDHRLAAHESEKGLEAGTLRILPMMCESAISLLNAASYARMPARVAGITWGAEDLAVDVGALANRNPAGEYEFTFQLARSACLLSAAAAGVPAIDTVDTEIRDSAVVEQRARISRRDGFLGKLAIHPGQVAPIHAAFTPTEDELRWARRVIEAFAASPGTGAVALEGKLLDRPHLRRAEQLLGLEG